LSKYEVLLGVVYCSVLWSDRFNDVDIVVYVGSGDWLLVAAIRAELERKLGVEADVRAINDAQIRTAGA